MNRKDLDLKIVIAGIGGQGVLFLARVLYEMARLEGREVLGSETHGMSQRGGSVTSHVKIGAYQSPMVRKGTADALVVLKAEEAFANLAFLRRGGTLLLNAPGTFRLEKGIQGALEGGRITVLRKDATACAEGMGHPRAANVILLSAAVGSGLFPMDRKTLIEAVRAVSPARVANRSLAAVEAGFSL